MELVIIASIILMVVGVCLISCLSSGTTTTYSRKSHIDTGIVTPKYINCDNMLYFDIETTGLKYNSAKITVISWFYNGEMKHWVNNGTGDPVEFIEDWNKSTVVCTYNGDGFDIPFVKHYFGRYMDDKISLDLYKEVKALKLRSDGYHDQKLKHICETLGITFYFDNDFSGSDAVTIWKKIEKHGDFNSDDITKLIAYCCHDVYLLVSLHGKLYAYGRPYVGCKFYASNSWLDLFNSFGLECGTNEKINWSNLKPLYEYTYEDLKARYKDENKIVYSREYITNRDTQWDDMLPRWKDSGARITTGQSAVLDGHGVGYSQYTTKYEASCMIDLLFMDDYVKRECERVEIANNKRKEYSDKLTAYQKDIQHLWNTIIDDDIITIDELLMFREWFKNHKTKQNKWKDESKLITTVKKDGKVDYDEMSLLYNMVINVIHKLEDEISQL